MCSSMLIFKEQSHAMLLQSRLFDTRAIENLILQFIGILAFDSQHDHFKSDVQGMPSVS